MRKIYLENCGKFAFVDDEDFERVNQFKWRGTKNKRDRTWYAARSVITNRGGSKITITICMHRFILDCPKGMYVDHKNKNGLDNRRSNIETTTLRKNRLNAVDNRKTPCVLLNGRGHYVEVGILGRKARITGFKTEYEATEYYARLLEILP